MTSEQLILVGATVAAISGLPGLLLSRHSNAGQRLATYLEKGSQDRSGGVRTPRRLPSRHDSSRIEGQPSTCFPGRFCRIGRSPTVADRTRPQSVTPEDEGSVPRAS